MFLILCLSILEVIKAFYFQYICLDWLNYLRLFSGSTAVFKCQVTGEPAPKVTWNKGMKKLTTTKDKKVEVFYDEETQQHTISMKGKMLHNINYFTHHTINIYDIIIYYTKYNILCIWNIIYFCKNTSTTQYYNFYPSNKGWCINTFFPQPFCLTQPPKL